MSDYWGDLNVFFGAKSREEAEEMFDRLMDAASDVICGKDVGPDHECAMSWTAGGSIRSDEQEERRNRLEEAAPALYDALKNIVAICDEKMAPWDTTLQEIRDEAEKSLRIAEIAPTTRDEVRRRRNA